MAGVGWLIGVEAISFRVLSGPAPGYRDALSGVPVNVGNYGYSWSSTASGIYSLRLDFGMTWLNPSYTYNRAPGFQLRCLSE
ncbi:hypothetical protein [uncultured Rikenella sp.]|uniref:hypothetical protein n=1 Tax=uncultured Rikenella sp. TaxID=368003 RepID=UPI0025D7D3D1|nr:hypothetical protein [uncultured Rikenella sp.]